MEVTLGDTGHCWELLNSVIQESFSDFEDSGIFGSPGMREWGEYLCSAGMNIGVK